MRIDPRHLQTLVRLGNTLVDMRRFEPALDAYDRALAVSPLLLDALCNRGSALRALGRHQEALETYDRALTVAPASIESLYNRAHVLRDLQRFGEALQSYEMALALAPNNAAIHSMRGRTLVDLGRVKEALVSFNEAIATRPDFVEALYNSGVALERLDRDEEALQRYARVLALEPRHARALAARGNALLALERYDDALSTYDLALESGAATGDLLCNRGTALHRLGRNEEALRCYDDALAADAGFGQAWGNRGNVLQELHRYDEALESLERALAIDARHPMYWFNRGNALYRMGRLDDALQAYDRTIELSPHYSDAHFARGSLLLSRGDFARGWDGYEWRLRDPKTRKSRRTFAQPAWTGAEPLDGKTILLHAEQGLGDTLQFCRYAALLAARRARVVLEVPPPLKALLASLRGPDLVHASGEVLPPFDYHCALPSLPAAFRTDLASLPTHTPYLAADSERATKWRDLLGAKRRPRVGLAWSGNPVHRNDHNRSMPLATLMPLLDLDIEWISLQKVVRGHDAALLDTAPIRTFDAHLNDFQDSAGLIESLDLLISVDTAVAHLAGALHRPVWILLAHQADWRWMLERSDSPWYASARLFRQRIPGQWQHVIESVRAALGELR